MVPNNWPSPFVEVQSQTVSAKGRLSSRGDGRKISVCVNGHPYLSSTSCGASVQICVERVCKLIRPGAMLAHVTGRTW
jgi:hypothetical protein